MSSILWSRSQQLVHPFRSISACFQFFSNRDVIRLSLHIIGFYVLLSFFVDSRLYLLRRLNVVVALQKLIQLVQSFAQIVYTNFAIRVEIESQPVILNKNAHVAVSCLNVLEQLSLAIAQHGNQQAHEVCSFVDKKHHTLIDVLDCLLQRVGHLQTVILHLLELGDVVDIGVSQFVDLRRL